MKYSEYLKNGWNWVHFCGGIIGLWGLHSILGCQIPYAISVVLIIDLLKEFADEFFKDTIYGGRFGLDPDGADFRDSGMCLAGILIGLLCIILF